MIVLWFQKLIINGATSGPQNTSSNTNERACVAAASGYPLGLV